jgi:Na+/melibiose symporter-like transporter
MVASREKVAEEKDRLPLKQMLKSLTTDMSFLKIVMVSVLWSMATHFSTPFNGTYSIKELGLSMTMISIVTAIQSTSRALCSRPLGKYADKHSFAKMLNICFFVQLFAFGLNIFTVPSNGKLFYTIYHVLHAIGLAGINSGGMNLIYERVPKEMRVCALAFKNTLAGIVSFITTLFASQLVKRIQENGNKFFGMDLYAQQVMSAITTVGIIVLIIYLNTVVKKMNINKDSD